MRTIAIKMKSWGDQVGIISNYSPSRVLSGLLFTLGSLFILYVFLLGSMVFNIIERRALEVESRKLATEVGELELSYLSISNKIDLDYSHSLGFKETAAKFAPRKALGSLPSPKTANHEI